MDEIFNEADLPIVRFTTKLSLNDYSKLSRLETDLFDKVMSYNNNIKG
jgi:hypothetical protein